MEKAEFLDRIARELAKNGLKNDEILKYTDRVSSLLDEMPERDAQTILGGKIDLEEFVSGLLAERRNAARANNRPAAANTAAAAKEPRAEEKRTAPPVSPQGRTPQTPPEKDQTQKPAGKDTPPPRRMPPAKDAPAPRQTPAPEKGVPTPKPADSPAATAVKEQPAPARSRLAEKLAPKSKSAASPAPARGEVRVPARLAPEEADKTRPLPDGNLRAAGKKKTRITDTRDYSRFWLFFCLLSPLILFFGVALIALFAGAILLLALLTVFFILLLVVIAAGGTALVLVGAIYGATQLFGDATVAIGLYEIGEALIVGGGTLFLGILVYHAAIRLNPWLMKKVIHLAGRTFRRLRNLFYRVKGEMAR